MSHAIAAIISFCTNDYRFFKDCIEGVLPFSQQILVSVCDHFFDGSPENYALLEEVYRQFPDITFIEYAYDPAHLYGTYFALPRESTDWTHHWHNSARYSAYFFLDPAIEYLFFVDADEVIEGKKMRAWLDTDIYRSYAAMRFSMYWYFRSPQYRATTYDDLQLIVKRSAIKAEDLLDPDERMGTYLRIKGDKIRDVLGLDNQPMIHHYSWVRTKEEMLQKTRTWGHHWEKPWTQLIEEEFSREFSGVDFCRGYQYECVPVHNDPLQVKVPEKLEQVSLEEHKERIKVFSHVKRVDAQEIFRRDLAVKFAL